MEFLNNPDLTYILLAGGLIFAVLSLAAPGTGYLEIGAFFILGIAGWSIITYSLPINWWALVLILAGAVLFFFSIRSKRFLPLLAASILAVVVGSAYLFRSASGFQPVVNPWLSLSVSILSAGFFWITGRKASEAALTRPTHDLAGLIGKIGESKSPIDNQGNILLDSELWSARSEVAIPQGRRVRVIGREGFTLLVEPVNEQKNNPTN